MRCHIAPVTDSTIKAVLGPTNTGKTHLAIERMCAHSSGAIGFPLRLLAREVYDRVVAQKGAGQVALITGEERIEPANARYFCCTVEAMPRSAGDHAFLALDEAQLAADPERGHVFTDRLLHARGREETMLLGAATLEPLVRSLLPRAEIVSRPRFSTLTHIGPRKLSRLPPRSAIVAFSADQVYAVAEMLRRFRGGAAVVMGALSPETRNRQVALFQSGEVDYIVATDAIGMGLNLDVTHVAFAGLTKFDGRKQRRLFPAEMAQIAGRAGRHHKDGTFGTLAGQQGGSPEFTEEEIYAIEEHRFAPLTRLFWRESELVFDSLSTLIDDLERPPDEPELAAAPEAIDLAVLKRLAAEPLAHDVRGTALVRHFWEACSLPDFRQSGADTHARFVARLWQDLRHGHLGADYVAARIAELDSVTGDIHALQGRIAAIRSWAYICQRPDWVLARDEMAARARGVEARLSDALHARLTERFVNRRTAILMKTLGQDAALLLVACAQDGTVTVEGEAIGRMEGFAFSVDHRATHEDRRMLLAAGEKSLPRLLAERADALVASEFAGVELAQGTLRWDGRVLATLEAATDILHPRLVPARDLTPLPEPARQRLLSGLEAWLAGQLRPLAPLAALQVAARDPAAGSQARALLLTLVAGHGYVSREQAGLEHLPKDLRPFLRRLGVTFGALDVFARELLKPAPRRLLQALGLDRRPINPDMVPVLKGAAPLPSGYRPAGDQRVRLDIAEKLLRAAHDARSAAAAGRDPRRARFRIDPALAISTGLELASFHRLLGAAGFRRLPARTLAAGVAGPPAPDKWEWRPVRRDIRKTEGPAKPAAGNAFAALADLVR
ncbi:helicase-related protein [Altererythrobacter sp. H2]|uniref:helicase-related protein n=1 Tax=Altererythrobacter sp. H2 TaxID=3108391 RepID=UPI002B4BFEF5|nr:helicase-related protein [Altererythrobacter sp. H2]WRK96030.1 helicase-related protein [Altererythrobacter sp. H2]